LQKGELLSDVLSEKDRDTDAPNAPKGGITPGDVERIISYAFGIAAGIFILCVIAYTLSVVTSNNGGPNFVWLRTNAQTMAPLTLIAMVTGIVGFLIGFFVKVK
jgi:hypothetical protein